VDSLIDLQTAAPDETRFREFMYSLTQRLARRGVSLVMTCEVPELFGSRILSHFAASHLSDNVIMLNFYTDQGPDQAGRVGHQIQGQRPRQGHARVQHQPPGHQHRQGHAAEPR
jgi:hypothetical protein